MDPIDHGRLIDFTPNRLLVEHFSGMAARNRQKKALSPDAGIHNLPHFQMMKAAILAGRDRLGRNLLKGRNVVILGAKEGNDMPLEALAAEGQVYLVDLDQESLRAARDGLGDSSLRERVFTLGMDASLFATVLLEEARTLLSPERHDIDAAFEAVIAMHGNGEKLENLFNRDQPKGSLPINTDEVDLVVSSMTLSQFMTGYLQVLVQLFLEVFGREQVRHHFLSHGFAPGDGPEGENRIEKIQVSTLPLARRAAEAHIRELSRMASKDGIMILSDHALHGQGIFVTDSQVEVDTCSLKPYSGNHNEEKYLQYRRDRDRPPPPRVRIDMTEPDWDFTVEGADALKTILAGSAGAEILEEKNWWWVTERTRDIDQEPPAWQISYVETYILRPWNRG